MRERRPRAVAEIPEPAHDGAVGIRARIREVHRESRRGEVEGRCRRLVERSRRRAREVLDVALEARHPGVAGGIGRR